MERERGFFFLQKKSDKYVYVTVVFFSLLNNKEPE